ncbi:MAG TPA: DMT family transporter [Xanthobacteraceae bacterium]|nr:DMT family transporter [Xanthobacteraceae bacterium]
MWMSGVLLSFIAMAVSIRALGKTLNVFEILTIRNFAGVAFLAALAVAQPRLRLQLTLARIRLHLVRNAFNFAGQCSWALGITLLPFATVFALEFTTPAWVALFAVFVLGERLTAGRIAAVVLGLCGVVMIARPGLEGFRPASLLVLGAAIAFAASIVATKKLTLSQTTFAILFWMNAIQLPMNVIGSDPLFVLRLGAGDALPVLGVAASGLSSHLCLTNAFRHGDATVVVPLDFFRLPLIALIGFWFYGEALDPMVFVGAGLIIAGVLWNLREAARQ